MKGPLFYKPNTFRRVLIGVAIALAAILVIGLVLFLVNSALSSDKKVAVNNQPTITSLDFELDPGVTYKNAITDTAAFFYSTENLKILNSKGDVKQDISLKFPHPAVATKGSMALFYDRGGKHAVLYSGVKEKLTYDLEDNILLAALNKNGYVLFVTESNLHKCAVYVYNDKGKELFKWNSGSLSVIAADVSDNNKDITVSALNTDEGTIKNQVIMFNTAKEKPFTSDTYEKEMFSVIRYSGGYLYCIGTSNTYIYNGYGKCVGTAAYNGRELLRYAIDGDMLVLVFSGSSENSGMAEVKTFNHKGNANGSFTVLQEFDYLDARDGTIILNNGRTMSLLNNRCQEKRQINLNFDLRNFAFFGSNKKGIGITASGAEMIELH